MRVFSYVVVSDSGFAPNPFHGTCTLADGGAGAGVRAGRAAVPGSDRLGAPTANRLTAAPVSKLVTCR